MGPMTPIFLLEVAMIGFKLVTLGYLLAGGLGLLASRPGPGRLRLLDPVRRVGILGIAVIGQLWIILKQFAAANEQMKQAHDDSEKLNGNARALAGELRGRWGGQEGAVMRSLDLGS